jgi:hypothetical protein
VRHSFGVTLALERDARDDRTFAHAATHAMRAHTTSRTCVNDATRGRGRGRDAAR